MGTTIADEPVTGMFNTMGGAGQFSGLTKREHFAAQIMAAIAVPTIPGGHNANQPPEAEHKAIMAVRLADALIKELNRETR